MSSGMENLATGEGPVKREREEIKAVNNQGNSLPRKKFYRARAHCNPPRARRAAAARRRATLRGASQKCVTWPGVGN